MLHKQPYLDCCWQQLCQQVALELTHTQHRSVCRLQKDREKAALTVMCKHQAFTRQLQNNCGQATLEYVVVLLGFIGMVLILGALWRAFANGALVRTAQAAASNTVGGGLGGIQDILAA